jgi:hypothetical protein
MSKPEDYTVGWICSISTEHVAARSILDEEHEQLEHVSPSDDNSYTLGRIGNHNIAIAVLPTGELSTSSAAIVATHMRHSFPNIAFFLMVVIGGGAPSQYHDIRLGDVVVGSDGVLQCDLGKTVQNLEFQITGRSLQPPTVLRTAVNELMAQYEREGHRLEDLINGILEKNLRLQQKYKRPYLGSDRLYRSEVTHPRGDISGCAAACGDDPSLLIPRQRERK